VVHQMNYPSTPNAGCVRTPATADTSFAAPTATTVLLTAGASGSKVDEIRINQVLSTTATGVIGIFINKGGSSYHLIDHYEYSILALVVSGTIDCGAPIPIYYDNLELAAGWTLEVTNTVASGAGPTAATHDVYASGGDY
jgi:hypothetical protein